MAVKLALPKGRLLDETSALLRRADFGLSGYSKQVRFYHLKCRRFPNLLARVFHERDIPIQVAVGNYDLGICGLVWVEELLAKYPTSAVVKVKDLSYGQAALYITASRLSGAATVRELGLKSGIIRIASEYPNLAESFALKSRWRRFSVFPLWGAAEVYPPESADLALIPVKTGEELSSYGLVKVSKVLEGGAFLIANAASQAGKDLAGVVASIDDGLLATEKTAPSVEVVEVGGDTLAEAGDDTVWLALPDGHQQSPTLSLLSRANIQVNDNLVNRRPTTNLDGVKIKIIRPQDMPLQVANGNFDLAVTGRDWLREHRYQFPSSPVKELLDLKLGKVKIVAVVSKDLAVADVDGLRQFSYESDVPFRVASEYVNIADKYARDNHLGPYRVIPTWGASEAFVPEDADLLIENTQTGRTIARHNLKIVDKLFESTACLIGSAHCVKGKGKRIESIITALKAVVEGG